LTEKKRKLTTTRTKKKEDPPQISDGNIGGAPAHLVWVLPIFLWTLSHH
jgi:hypothetical protein